MHRFFLMNRALAVQQFVDLSEIAHQLGTVLRLRPGDQVLLLDGQGHSYPTRIHTLEPKKATGEVLAQGMVHSEPHCFLTLFQCALKADKFEWVLQKGTEIGVSRFVPVISSRTIVRPAEKIRKKYERWQTIIREAAEQSGRGRLPELADPLTWDEAVQAGTGVRLLPWEETSAHMRTHRLGAIVENMGAVASLLLGPEGGISEDEAAGAMAMGWRAVSLGPRILRAETAALVAATLVLHYEDRLG
jgi:16S rRNA (uracil1498-N3)-methyltransferase